MDLGRPAWLDRGSWPAGRPDRGSWPAGRPASWTVVLGRPAGRPAGWLADREIAGRDKLAMKNTQKPVERQLDLTNNRTCATTGDRSTSSGLSGLIVHLPHDVVFQRANFARILILHVSMTRHLFLGEGNTKKIQENVRMELQFKVLVFNVELSKTSDVVSRVQRVDCLILRPDNKPGEIAARTIKANMCLFKVMAPCVATKKATC